jgi:hypothetical protein
MLLLLLHHGSLLKCHHMQWTSEALLNTISLPSS